MEYDLSHSSEWLYCRWKIWVLFAAVDILRLFWWPLDTICVQRWAAGLQPIFYIDD